MGLVILFASCQKLDRPALGDYPKDANPPGGPLKFYTAFDGSTVDSIRATFSQGNPLTFTPNGISGQALQGADGKALKYPSANDFWKSNSFSIAWWMKSAPHADGAQFLFSMPSKDYWHNSAMFLLIESQALSTPTAATVKFTMHDQWFEFTGANRMPNILNGQWNHVVIVYDETTSKLSYYINGSQLTGLPANLTDVKKSGNPRGPAAFKNIQNFIVSGFGKHVSIDGPTDAWVKSYTGQLDQFRLYGKALTAAEVTALYNSKL